MVRRADRGSLSDAILSLVVVTCSGQVLSIDRTSNLFPALSVSLGTLGVIYAVTLQCEDLYAIEGGDRTHEMVTIIKYP